jgi:AP-1 complex subunit gamma-1
LRSDLVSANQFVAGLALCALGNISSSGMARDLAPEVQRCLVYL